MKKLNFITELSEWRSFVDSDIGRATRKFFVAVCTNVATKSNKYDIFITFLMILIQYIPYTRVIKRFWNFDGDRLRFSIDAWLISYEGGFVRRGLSGEIIKIIEYMTDILPHVIVGIISISVFIVLVVWTIGICGKKIPIFFIFSPFFFAFTARSDKLFGTDYIMFLLFLCALTLIVSNKNRLLTYIIVNLICVFAILTKEVFVFSCLPILVIVYNLRNSKQILSFKFIYFFLVPVIATIVVGYYNNLSPESGQKIIDYWNEIYRQKIPDFCCFENGYFRHIMQSWSGSHLSGVEKVWNRVLYGFIWVPMYWLFVWYFCGLFTAKVIMHYDAGREKIYLGFYYFSTLCSLPLYILGWDYGRWILMVSICSFLATYTINSNVHLPKFVDKFQIRTWKSPLRLWHKVLIVMFFGIPSFINHFGMIYYAAPIWYPLQFLISIEDLAELGLLGR